MNAHHKSFKAFLLCVIVAFTPALRGQHISDLKMRYSGTAITEAKLENVGTLPVDFYRQNLEVEVGLGQTFVGMSYQYATKKKHSQKPGNKFGKVEDGAMLTAGYNHIFSDRVRFETQGRVEIWGDTKPAHESDHVRCRWRDVSGRKPHFPLVASGSEPEQIRPRASYGRRQFLVERTGFLSGRIPSPKWRGRSAESRR